VVKPLDLVMFLAAAAAADVGACDGRLEEESDERHESRTDLRRAQWNVKMNTPCRFTPTMNTT